MMLTTSRCFSNPRARSTGTLVFDGPGRLRPAELSLLLQEPGVGAGDALVELDRRPPAQPGQPGDVQQLARGSVRLAGVPLDRAVVADHLGDGRRQLRDR